MMSVRGLVAAAIRVYALLVLLKVFGLAGTSVVYGLSAPGPPEAFSRPEFMISTVSLVVLVAFVVLVFNRTETVVNWVMRHHPAENDGLTVSPESLTTLALALVGVVFVVTGLSDVASRAAVWYFLPRDSHTGQRIEFPLDWPMVVGSALTVIAGVALVLGRAGAMQMFHQLRGGRSVEPKVKHDDRKT